MVEREAKAALARLVRGFPAVCVTGPRQTGKTTLVKAAFPKKPYLSLEDPDVGALAAKDPRGLLEAYPAGLILDEAQYAPGLFAYLKTMVDRDAKAGKYIITGSRQFSLLEKVAESLAGRAAFLTLMPFTSGELESAGLASADPDNAMLKGFYPPLYDRKLTAYDWYSSYIASYIERDVRSVVNVRKLSVFQNFLKFCAVRSGSLLNLSALAGECGITHNTANEWISVLETCGIVFLLRPFFRNYGKRLVKTPKLYFTDPGLLCRLLNIKKKDELFLHPSRGHIFESFIISDIIKTRFNRGLQSDLYFWCDNSGLEVDIIIDEGSSVKAVEIKSSKTFSSEFQAGLVKWLKFSGEKQENCAVVYAGKNTASPGGIPLVPWNRASSLAGEFNA